MINNIAYFDNAATTFPKPEEVYDFMDKFYREYGVNVGRGQHKLSSKANSLVTETRDLLLELNHCPNKKVVFTHTATEALNIIIQGLPLRNNINIYVSPFEHNAVTRVLHYISNKIRVNIEKFSFDKSTNTFDLMKIEYQFSEKSPDIVIISHASNVFGIISPVSEICKLSKKYKSINIIDMCQTMGLIDTDLSDINIDFAVFAGHKTLYGPFGVGGFITSGEIKVSPLLFGGTGIDSANQSLPEGIPEKYEIGSMNISAISGLHASLNWIKMFSINHIYCKEKENHKKLLSLLKKYDNIKILSPDEENESIGVVSCLFSGFSSDNIGQILNEHNIAVRTGLQCSPEAHKFFGTFPAGTVRFSVGYFNTDEDFYNLESTLNLINENS